MDEGGYSPKVSEQDINVSHYANQNMEQQSSDINDYEFSLWYHAKEYQNKDGTLPDKINRCPIQALSNETKYHLSKLMDNETTTCNSHGTLQNYVGLAEYMDLRPEVVDYISEYRHSKTFYVLIEWSRYTPSHTIGDLWCLLQKLEMQDVIMDGPLYAKIVSDGNIHIRKQKANIKSQTGHHFWNPLRKHHKQKEDPSDNLDELIINPERALKLRRDDNRESGLIVVQDVECKGEDRIIFDAYVSYCDKNLTFIRELSRFLEKDHKLKLCLNERDLLVGSCKYDAIAEIISNRCRKMIIVLSEEYLCMPECDYQSKLALSFNRSSIIIMYKKCEVPKPLKPFSVLRHHELPTSWFWNRLQCAVKDEKTSIFNTKQQDQQPRGSVTQKIPKPLSVFVKCVLPQKSKRKKHPRRLNSDHSVKFPVSEQSSRNYDYVPIGSQEEPNRFEGNLHNESQAEVMSPLSSVDTPPFVKSGLETMREVRAGISDCETLENHSKQDHCESKGSGNMYVTHGDQRSHVRSDADGNDEHLYTQRYLCNGSGYPNQGKESHQGTNRAFQSNHEYYKGSPMNHYTSTHNKANREPNAHDLRELSMSEIVRPRTVNRQRNPVYPNEKCKETKPSRRINSKHHSVISASSNGASLSLPTELYQKENNSKHNGKGISIRQEIDQERIITNEESVSLASDLYQNNFSQNKECVETPKAIVAIDHCADDSESIDSLEDERLESGYNSDQTAFTSIVDRAVSPVCKSEMIDSGVTCEFDSVLPSL